MSFEKKPENKSWLLYEISLDEIAKQANAIVAKNKKSKTPTLNMEDNIKNLILFVLKDLTLL